MIKTILTQKLAELLSANNISVTQLARDIGSPQPTIYKLVTGHSTDPRISTLNKIAEYFKVDINYFTQDKSQGHDVIEQDLDQAIARLPVIDWNHIDHIDNILPIPYNDNWLDWIRVDRRIYNFSNKAFALPYDKHGANGSIISKGYLILDTEKPYHEGDQIVCINNKTNKAVLRKVEYDGANVLLKPHDPQILASHFNEDWKFIATVALTLTF